MRNLLNCFNPGRYGSTKLYKYAKNPKFRFGLTNTSREFRLILLNYFLTSPMYNYQFTIRNEIIKNIGRL